MGDGLVPMGTTRTPAPGSSTSTLRTNDAMRTIGSLAAILVATVAIGTVAPPATAGSTAGIGTNQEEPAQGLGIRLTEAPVSAGDDPRAKVYIVDHIAPGTV